MYHRVGRLRHLIEQKYCDLLKHVPLRFEREGRGAVPPRPAGRNVATEAQAALCLRLALRVCASLTITKTSSFGSLCRRCFPKGIAPEEEGSASPIEQYAD